MEATRWGRIAEIYSQACEVPASQRESFLTDACHGDAELRREIDLLLAQNVSRDGPLERVAKRVEQSWNRPPSSPEWIGGYRILRLIGEGGMGAVYEAEQKRPRRVVALKVLRSPLAGSELTRRFEFESEALGRLQHPGVARIYEAGVAATGSGLQPYFAMELIRGLSLNDFAVRQALDTRRRVELMIRICEAVEHAHQRGIIHRDLKPANILVDESSQPKILDFGVARLTESDAGATRHTSLGDLVGTLAYMSPEQFMADPGLMDSRSDIYSLGVILYELLAGRRPYELSRALPEAARIVREQDPAPLGSVSREYAGDLETIVAKALEKDRTRRYVSAAGLGADLRCYLAHEPILAKPPSRIYHARKFVRRHRVLAGAAAAVFVVLAGGIALSTREAIRASRERDRALRAEQVANAVNDFLQNDLLSQAGARAQAGTRAAPDPDLKVRTALDRAAARIPGKFDFQPAVEAAIRRTIGLAYIEMNLNSEAQPELERAAELRKRALGPEHPDTLTSLDELGNLYILQGKYPAAETLLNEVLTARRRVLGPDHADTLATMSNLGQAISYSGGDARAAPMIAGVLAAYRRLRGEENRETLPVMDNLACVYLRLGRFADGASLLEREVELKKRILGPEHPDTLNGMHNLATAYRDLGEYRRADSLFRDVWQARRKALGEEHWETASTRLSWAISYRAQGRCAEAEAAFKSSAESLARGLGAEHPLTLKALYHLAKLYQRQRRFADAETLFTRVLEARRRVLGAENPYTAEVQQSFGEMKLQQERYDSAEKLLSEALRIRVVKTPEAWERYYSESMLGASRAALGKPDEARALLRSGNEGMQRLRNSIPDEYQPVLDHATQWLAQVR